jgi:hypothetical protein
VWSEADADSDWIGRDQDHSKIHLHGRCAPSSSRKRQIQGREAEGAGSRRHDEGSGQGREQGSSNDEGGKSVYAAASPVCLWDEEYGFVSREFSSILCNHPGTDDVSSTITTWSSSTSMEGRCSTTLSRTGDYENAVLASLLVRLGARSSTATPIPSFIEVRPSSSTLPLPYLRLPSQTSKLRTSSSPRRATSRSSTLDSQISTRPSPTSTPSAALSTLPPPSSSTPSPTLDPRSTCGPSASSSTSSSVEKCHSTTRACRRCTPRSSEGKSSTPPG